MTPSDDDVTEYRLNQLENDLRALAPTAGEVLIVSVKVEGLVEKLKLLDEREERHHKELLDAIEEGSAKPASLDVKTVVQFAAIVVVPILVALIGMFAAIKGAQ